VGPRTGLDVIIKNHIHCWKLNPGRLARSLVAIPPGVKVKLSLCLTKHHAMKACWGNGGIAQRILDLGTRWR
jgi:hypothetical protein